LGLRKTTVAAAISSSTKEQPAIDEKNSEMEPGGILDIDELSQYLRIPKSTLYVLVRERRIPSQKVGRQWRFRREAIDRWLERSEPDGGTAERAQA
jgi:excisionase family DNA binding protein